MPHALVVEDNEVNRLVTSKLLEKAGCHVSTAVNGLIAIEMIQSAAFDILFMDCDMPEMDGFEATRHIRVLMDQGRIARIPIIALTAHAMPDDRAACLKAGMDDYLVKPARKAEIIAMLAKWLPEA